MNPPDAARPRTLLGFDFGRARIGVAVGQELTATARPLTTLASRRQRPDWEAIARLIDEWRPQLLVVGVPHHADGSTGPVAAAALRFGRQLHGRFSVPVSTIDERLSSWEAERRLGDADHHVDVDHRGEIDAAAAALILESWLNRQDPSDGER